MSRGMWYAISAYVIWGLLTIFWKTLQHVPALQLICHRIVWSCVLLTAYVLVSGQAKKLFDSAKTLSVLRIYTAAALFITTNWLIFVWGVNAGYVVETSLGYFINPLVSVLIGVVFLHERLRRGQWHAVVLAGIGVLVLGFAYGAIPWIALTLAFSFAFYGLIKKHASLNSIQGLTLETMIIFLPALGYLIYAETQHTGALMHTDINTNLMLVATGVITIVPLLMFSSAARSISLTHIGILQYLAPTIQFLVGVFIYHESVTRHQYIGFGLVWTALFIFALDGVLAHRRK
ncbi:MAG: EamA family transporter RarD [Burkholderiales bacterium]